MSLLLKATLAVFKKGLIAFAVNTFCTGPYSFASESMPNCLIALLHSLSVKLVKSLCFVFYNCATTCLLASMRITCLLASMRITCLLDGFRLMFTVLVVAESCGANR